MGTERIVLTAADEIDFDHLVCDAWFVRQKHRRVVRKLYAAFLGAGLGRDFAEERAADLKTQLDQVVDALVESQDREARLADERDALRKKVATQEDAIAAGEKQRRDLHNKATQFNSDLEILRCDHNAAPGLRRDVALLTARLEADQKVLTKLVEYFRKQTEDLDELSDALDEADTVLESQDVTLTPEVPVQ
jgi:septal ring factor EnvC (AmiA/AmiB activator)